MDRKDEYTDDNIEELFRAMPDIKEERTKEEILLKLKEDDRLKSRHKKNSLKNKRSKWIPAIVAISAIFLFSLLLPSMYQMNQKDDSTNFVRTMDQDTSEEMDAASELEIKMESEASESEEFKSSLMTNIPELDNYMPVVYPKDVIDRTVFHIGFASDAAASLPVTFVIPNEQIQRDFGKTNPTSFDLYSMYADKIDEGALGFTSYHPYKGELNVEDDAIIQTLPKGHNYDLASATMTTYFATLQDTFYGFKEIIFANDDGTPVEFDQVGEPSEPMLLMSGKDKVNYYLFKQDNGQEFLSSNFGGSYETLEIALNAMKVKPNDVYLPIIPETISFELTTEKDLMTITFNEPLDLNKMELKSAQQMIDGILLTAASFDTRVKFVNIVQSEWREFNFSEALPMPIGANNMRFMLK